MSESTDSTYLLIDSPFMAIFLCLPLPGRSMARHGYSIFFIRSAHIQAKIEIYKYIHFRNGV
jgi:hypothetical protein